MDSETKEALGPTPPVSAEVQAEPEISHPALQMTEFYRVRHRIYLSLMFFVVAVGMPMLSVPALRQRLSNRIQTLHEAMAGGSIKPAVARVGENSEPFPSEYAKKPNLPNYPKLPAYLGFPQGSSIPAPSSNPAQALAEARTGSADPVRGNRLIKIPRPITDSGTQPAPIAALREPAVEQGASGPEAQPKYQQGEMERAAYELLLESNLTVSGMVRGSNPALRFKAWDALKREEDVFWVRLIFVSAPDNTNLEYIWQIKLLAKQVTPLSYNARSLAGP